MNNHLLGVAIQDIRIDTEVRRVHIQHPSH